MFCDAPGIQRSTRAPGKHGSLMEPGVPVTGTAGTRFNLRERQRARPALRVPRGGLRSPAAGDTLSPAWPVCAGLSGHGISAPTMVLSASRSEAQSYADTGLARKGKEELVRGERDGLLGLASRRRLAARGPRAPAWRFGKQKETVAVLRPTQTSWGSWRGSVRADRGLPLLLFVRLSGCQRRRLRTSLGAWGDSSLTRQYCGAALGEFTFPERLWRPLNHIGVEQNPLWGPFISALSCWTPDRKTLSPSKQPLAWRLREAFAPRPGLSASEGHQSVTSWEHASRC